MNSAPPGARRTVHVPGTPPPGPQYRCFNHAMMLAGLAVAGYLANDPTQVTRAAIAGPLGVDDSVRTWGVLLLTAGLVGAAAAYSRRTLVAGYVVTIVAALFMCGACLAGVVVFDAPGQGWIWTLIYGYVLQNTISDGTRPDARPGGAGVA